METPARHARKKDWNRSKKRRAGYWDMAIYDKESMELLIKRVGATSLVRHRNEVPSTP
jgi:hypothetical protein